MTAPQSILGLDYGDKRVGVAVAHVIARLPHPLTTIPNDENLMSKIQHILEQESAGVVVVGLPRGMDGGYTEQTRKTEEFAKALQAVVAVPVELCDETLTSVEAEGSLGSGPHAKGDTDAMAASLILGRYLAEHPLQGAAS